MKKRTLAAGAVALATVGLGVAQTSSADAGGGRINFELQRSPGIAAAFALAAAFLAAFLPARKGAATSRSAAGRSTGAIISSMKRRCSVVSCGAASPRNGAVAKATYSAMSSVPAW